MLISTKDELHNDDMSLIEQDVAGEPLSDNDDDAKVASSENDIDASVQGNEVLRSSTKDPIEGQFFEGDISGVRIVAKSDVNVEGQNVTIKNAIINTYQVTQTAATNAIKT